MTERGFHKIPYVNDFGRKKAAWDTETMMAVLNTRDVQSGMCASQENAGAPKKDNFL